jgi:hypothetical protein
VREFHLRSRNPEHPEEAFVFKPGMTVEALDDREELLLATVSADIVDVAKETPALANTLADLQRQLDEEKAKNAKLMETHDALKDEVAKANRRTSAKK